MPQRKKKKIRIGIVGCGAIGSNLALHIHKQFSSDAAVSFLCDHHEDRIKKLIKKLGSRVRQCSARQLVRSSDLIIEAASVETVAELLSLPGIEKKQVLIMSVGGLVLKPALLKKFLKRAQGRLYVPAGAIAGVDGLLASRESGVKKVLLRTCKPPHGLEQAAFFEKKPFPKLRGNEEVCVFRGNASRAIEAFPQNVNVAAILSLAGLGAEKTRVEVWTSRSYKKNMHQIMIESAAGKISVEVENRPYPENPKTSALAMHSAMAALRQIFSPLHIGA